MLPMRSCQSDDGVHFASFKVLVKIERSVEREKIAVFGPVDTKRHIKKFKVDDFRAK